MLLLAVTVGERGLGSTLEVVMSHFRSSLGRQYPSSMQGVVVGEASTASVPCSDTGAMWSKLGRLQANRMPATDWDARGTLQGMTVLPPAVFGPPLHLLIKSL